MKKSIFVLLMFVVSINLTACVTPVVQETSLTQITEPTLVGHLPEFTQEISIAESVVFSDPVLETMIRGAMGKPEGGITTADAKALTRLDLSNEWQHYFPDEAVISELGGLESFTNLESLDLSFNAITDITALSGLTKLTRLSLAENPVGDISPLAGLTNLKALNLSNCQAPDYSPLANLDELEFLKLDNSSISDLSALSELLSLKYLYLANSPVNDLLVLAEVYPNLEEKDFIVPSTLEELGFTMDDNDHQAWFDTESASIKINHSTWGSPPWEWDADIIRVTTILNDVYKASIGWYGDIDAYVFQMVADSETFLNYVYDPVAGEFTIGEGDRESSEQMASTVFEVVEGEDVLLAPFTVFNEIITNAFHMTPEALYALPFEPPTLKSLGFYPDKENAVCLYEQRGEWDYNLEFHRPEWGEKDFDVRFFTPISDEYRIVSTYHVAENKIHVSIDDNSKGGAAFVYYLGTNEYEDEWCSYEDKTVEEYFIKAFDDPEIVDVYQHAVEMMENYFIDRFGMTFQELYALPPCE